MTLRKPVLSLAGLFQAGVALCGVCSVLGFAGRFWWGLDLLAHFRIQYAVALAVACAASLALRQRRMAGLWLVLVAINLVCVAPRYLVRPDVPSSGAELRAMLYNVNTGNENHDAVIAEIRAADPDLVVLQEVNRTWRSALRVLDEDYPHQLLHTQEDNFGIGLWSRYPLEEARTIVFGGIGTVSVLAQLEVGGQSVNVVGTHPVPPVRVDYAALRNDQLEAAGEYVDLLKGPVLLLGDLNATPWSRGFKLLCQGSGLRDSGRGFGIQPSWPTSLWPLLIPLDHVLHSEAFVTVGRRLGEANGSDHRPVIVDLVLRGRSAKVPITREGG